MASLSTSLSFTATQQRTKGISPVSAPLPPDVEAILSTKNRPLPSSGNRVIDRVKALVLEGGGSIRTLSRVLFLIDDSGGRGLSREEFVSGLLAAGLPLDPMEVEELMDLFGGPRDGKFLVPNFIRALRGDMSSDRWRLVNEVYDLLDMDKDNHVTFDVIKASYDVQNHPLVLAKERSPQQVLAEFLRHWDKNGDTTISREEFQDYYADVSAGIADDQYFELLLYKTWHLKGGEAMAVTGRCKRVLVIHTNGTQTIEPVINDAGLRADEVGKIIDRLRRQGITTAKNVYLL